MKSSVSLLVHLITSKELKTLKTRMKNQWTPIFSNKSIRKTKQLMKYKTFCNQTNEGCFGNNQVILKKFKKNTFSSFWMPVIKQNFGKATRQTWQCCLFGPEMSHLLPMWAKWVLIFLLNPNSPFYPLFNACQQIQFRKAKLTDLSKVNIVLIFDIKMKHLSHFDHNMNFPCKYKTVTFNHSLMPVIRWNLRKT